MIDVPMPPDDPENRPHWDAAKRGVLLIQRCAACGQCRFPATRACTRCHHVGGDWIKASGLGEIESFCVFHKAYWPAVREALPYTVVQVRLREGVRVMSNFVAPAGRSASIGLPVRARFDPVRPELTLVRFAPLV
jgi:Predicted nucleic-acid-binding protein containing a Zn-ribbon